MYVIFVFMIIDSTVSIYNIIILPDKNNRGGIAPAVHVRLISNRNYLQSYFCSKAWLASTSL